MAKFLSEIMTGKRSVPQPDDADVDRVPVSIVLPVAALAAGDLLSLIQLPPGVTLVDYDVFAPQLDSNGAPALALSIGSENAAGDDLGVVYEAGLTPGRTANGSVSRCGNAVALNADNSVARKIALKVTTIAATWAGAGKTVTVLLALKG